MYGPDFSYNNIPRIPWQHIRLGDLIGNGSFGDVHKAIYERKEVAVKVFLLKSLPFHLKNDFDNESRIMWQCRSRNIVELYGICDEPGRFSMVMEYMPKGSLNQLLHDLSQELTEERKWAIAIGVAEGLTYLHSKNILHKDLKSNNILLNDTYCPKISDFGLSTLKLETNISSNSTLKKSAAGTIRWRAPELLNRGSNASKASDVYSYGMVLWEIISRKIPYSDTTDEQTVISWIKQGEKEIIPEYCPILWKEIIKNCWSSPDVRPEMLDITNKLKQGLVLQGFKTLSLATQPWYFEPTLIRDTAEKVQKKGYQLIQAEHYDFSKALESYHHHPVPGYEVTKVEVIYNPNLNNIFGNRLQLLQHRYENTAFDAKFEEENESEDRKKWRAEVSNLWKLMSTKYVDSNYPQVKLLPLWHGTNLKILDSIFKTGYANLAKTDDGYFGKGLYSAYEAEYSWRCYSKGALIMNWVSMYSAYPVIDGDMPKLQAKGNYQNYDSHFVPVIPDRLDKKTDIYYPCQPGQKHQYIEVVVFDSAQCLPRYLVTLQATLLKSPLIFSSNKLSPRTERSIDKFFKYVGYGQQEEAEAMLKGNPKIGLAYSDLVDCSDRNFKNITAFQYAVLALDYHMWTMIKKYLDKQNIRIQLEELNKIVNLDLQQGWFTIPGKFISWPLINWASLVKALNDYVDNYDKWDYAQRSKHWCQQVGGAQLILPAHVINEYSHPSRLFYPCPKWGVNEPALPRTGVANWKNAGNISQYKLGNDFAWCRADWSEVHARQPGDINNKAAALLTRSVQLTVHRCLRWRSMRDLAALNNLLKTRIAQAQLLLESELSYKFNTTKKSSPHLGI